MRRLLLLGAAALAAPAVASAQGATDLDGVVVTASRNPTTVMQAPFNVSVVTRDDIERSGATRLEDAFRAVPGLQMGTQGNAYFRIATRGFRDTADVLVLVDGVPFHQLNGSADLVMLPVGIIDRIEFVKGPGSAAFGRGAVGGVVQIFTRPTGSAALAEAQGAVGSDGFVEGRTRLALPFAKGTFHLQAGGSKTDGFQDDVGRDGNYISAALSQALNETVTAGLEAGYSRIDTRRGSIIPLIGGRPAYGVTREVNYGVRGARLEGEYTSVSVPVTAAFGGWTVKNVLNWNAYNRFATGGITIVPAPAAVTRGWSESDTKQNLIYDELVARWSGQALGGRTDVAVGGAYEHGELKQFSPSFSNAPTYRAPNFNTPVSNVNNDPRGIRGAVTATNSDQTVKSLFVDAAWRAGPLGLQAGVRWDEFEQSLRNSNTAVVSAQTAEKTTLRVGADFAFISNDDQTWTVFANYAEGFKPQFPALSTQAGVVIPQLLRPEFTASKEIGLKAKLLGGRVLAQGSWFDMEREDAQRSFRTGPDTFIFQNARQRVKGFEGQVQARLTSAIDAYATYAWHDARNTEFVTTAGNFSGNRVRMAPEHYAGAGVNLTAGPLNYNLTANYVGERPLRDNLPAAQIQQLPSYTVVNASVRWTIGNKFLQATVNNIGDEFYISDDFSAQEAGNAGAPRSFVLSAGLRF